MSFSPASNCQKPPSGGIAFATATRAFAAVADAVIELLSIPATAAEYSFIPSPKGISFLPKPARSFSPASNCQKPPSGGTALATSTKAFAAVAEAVIEAVSIPETDSPKSFIPFPNGTSCSAKSANELPPVRKEAMLSTILAAVNINTALANACTPSIIEGSIP